MQRTPVKSSQIVSVGHDPATSTLEIEFPGRKEAPHGGQLPGPVYRYTGVSAEDASKFMQAESIGKHFGQHIKGKFEYARVEQQPVQEV